MRTWLAMPFFLHLQASRLAVQVVINVRGLVQQPCVPIGEGVGVHVCQHLVAHDSTSCLPKRHAKLPPIVRAWDVNLAALQEVDCNGGAEQLGTGVNLPVATTATDVLRPWLRPVAVPHLEEHLDVIAQA